MANCVFVVTKMLRLCKFTIAFRCKQAWKMSRCHANKPQAMSDWLNPYSLGMMSAFRYIGNLT